MASRLESKAFAKRIRTFDVMLKPRGPICNLDCEYCYYLEKESLYPNSDNRMTDDVLEDFIQQYIQSNACSSITFAWQGGEPTLMGLDFFQKAVDMQKKYAQINTHIENCLQTNGTLLNDEWCQFFKQNNFLIGISIDGPAAYHDIYRKDKGGKPSSERVMQGLMLLKKHGVEFNILASVHAGNSKYPLEIYRFFRDDLKAKYIQFIPIVELDNKAGEQKGNKVTERSVNAEMLGDFLIAIFDEWVRHDVGEIFVQIFDVALGKWLGVPGGLCVFDKICGRSLAMEHNGDLYSCDHFVEPCYRLGNIIETDIIQLIDSQQQKRFGYAKLESLPKYCMDCEVRFACNGGCPKNRIRQAPDGDYGLNYLCKGYRAFFNHIDQPMKTMTELIRSKRQPSEIMKVS